MNHAFKTKNGNWMIPDGSFQRFISSDGTHIRWIDDQECQYLMRVLECRELDKAPKPLTMPEPPKEERIWQYVEPSEHPHLSSNGGSYAYLYRIVLRSGWDIDSMNGYVLVSNHLYNSDYEDQGWNEKSMTELEAMSYIENFKIGVEA